MPPEDATDHEHELEAEFLSLADAVVLDVYDTDGSLHVDVAVPCPTCGEPLRVSARAYEVTETDVDLPPEDADDVYD